MPRPHNQMTRSAVMLAALSFALAGRAVAEEDPDIFDPDEALGEFTILDDGTAPQADDAGAPVYDDLLYEDLGESPDDLLGVPEQEPAARSRARKKKSSDDPPSPEDFELEGVEDPIEDFDIGGEPLDDLDGEIGESDFDLMGDPIEDFDLDPVEDLEGDPLGDLEALPEEQGSAAASGPGLATPGAISLDVVGKEPLADNYPARIVATDRDSVVVELPILLGRSRSDFGGEPYWIAVEVKVAGEPVAETRQRVTAASLAEFGPSFMFAKVLAPVPDKSGNLEIGVSRVADGSGESDPLYTRTVSYLLP